MDQYLVFIFGCLGGCLAELAHLFTMRKRLATQMPRYLRSSLYWSITALMVIAGGLLAFSTYYGTKATPLLAIQSGLIAPLLIHKLSLLGNGQADAKTASASVSLRTVLRGDNL